MKILIKIILIVAISLTLVQCKSDPKSADKTATPALDDHDHEELEEGTVVFSAEQVKTIGIEIGSIENKQLSHSLKANGVLKVPNQNKATINSLYAGIVQKILVEPGFNVKKGQVIALLSNPEFIEIQTEYLNTIHQIENATLEADRQKTLYEGNAGALKNLQAAESQLQTMKNKKSMYAKQIQLMGINPSQVSSGKMVSELAIKSPIAGTVSSIGVEMGSYVTTTAVIAEIIDNSQLHVDLFVYEQDLPKLKNKQTIHFILTNNPGREYDAQIFSLGNNFIDGSKAVSIHAKVMGDKTGLIDGMDVTAIVSLEDATVTAVPNEAIVSDKGSDYIFIVVPNEAKAHVHIEGEDHDHDPSQSPTTTGDYTFKKVLIAKGTTDIGYTEITVLGTLPAHASIVTKGAFFVIAKMNDNGEGHEH